MRMAARGQRGFAQPITVVAIADGAPLPAQSRSGVRQWDHRKLYPPNCNKLVKLRLHKCDSGANGLCNTKL